MSSARRRRSNKCAPSIIGEGIDCLPATRDKGAMPKCVVLLYLVCRGQVQRNPVFAIEALERTAEASRRQ